MTASQDQKFMLRALALAREVGARSRPNPRVGAVLVQNGNIIGEGSTQRAGYDHAEIVALKNALADGHLVNGATLYVTLEPCAHFGRTPPCAKAIIEAGISRVVVATDDPFPKVNGTGIAMLRAAGIVVEVGLERATAREINAGFISRIEKQRPWCRVKVAASIDGTTALSNGQSQWISSAASRLDAHHWRAQSCAIMTGVGTVLADDPRLTVRDVPMTIPPTRIVVDSHARIPLTAKILQGEPIILVSGEENANTTALRNRGHQVLICPTKTSTKTIPPTTKVDLVELMRQLAQLELNEILVEAGSTLTSALLNLGVVDELLCYLAPKLLGTGRGWVNWQLSEVSQGLDLSLIEHTTIGEDLRLRFKISQ